MVLLVLCLTSPLIAQPVTDGADHAALIQKWDNESLARGEKLYTAVCITCHGTPEQPGTLPTSRAFWKEPFKNGSDPFSLYKTIGQGLNQMPPQLWMTPEQRYDVVYFYGKRSSKNTIPKSTFQSLRNIWRRCQKHQAARFRKLPR
jgi:cytochrome c5